jgi:hypothetical protein
MVTINLESQEIGLNGFELIDCKYVAEQETTVVQETTIIPDADGIPTGIDTRYVKSTTIRLKPVLEHFYTNPNGVIEISVPEKETVISKKINIIPPIKKKIKK